MAKQKPFIERVYARLGKRPKSSTEIAIQLGLVTDDGSATPYGAAKVRRALQELAAQRYAVQEGAFRTSKYRLP